MKNPYADPENDPPADLSPAESRRYVEAIVEMLRESPALDAELALDGEIPNTVLVLRFVVPNEPNRLLEARVPIWPPPSYVSPIDGKRYFDSAVWKAGAIGHRFIAGEFVGGAREVEQD